MAQEALLLNVPEAAALLRLGRNRTYELVADGRLPAVRVGRTIRIPRQAIEIFIANEAGLGEVRSA
jgi:excisionase family DNA binding protein